MVSNFDTKQESMNFPSFTLFQRKDWTSQPNLQSATSPKCFLGWHDESAPDCGTRINPDDTLLCQCGDSWDDSIRNFQWQNTSYRALKFQASEAMVSASPTLSMLAQTFFSYNTKKHLPTPPASSPQVSSSPCTTPP
jgi:hypothetical protein